MDTNYNPLEDVVTWNEVAGNNKGDQTKAGVYINLIKEEFGEWLEAVGNEDSGEELDALVDMIWVIVGRAHTRGYDLAGALEEVANSNFSKFLYEADEVEEEVSKLKEEGVVVTAREKFDLFVLVDEKGKIRKPSSYKPADCSKYVE